MKHFIRETDNYSKEKKCIDCGILINNKATRCRSCCNTFLKTGIKYPNRKKGYIVIKNRGKNNGMWKGDNVGFNALHDWINRNKPKPLLCECCKEKLPYDLANISGEYKRDINDFEWLCRRCHMIKDGRIIKLIQIAPRNNPRDINGRFCKND